MIFRRIIFNALLVGLLAGLVLSAAQLLAVNPIIFEAESFEVAGHDHGAHDHSEEAWAPADGLERNLYTLLANVLAGIGFSAVLLALMSQMQSAGITKLSTFKGVLWGLAGFVVFFVAPGIGLPPEIPGIEAAPVEHRQWWWLLSVISAGVGLMLIAFAPLKIKFAGVIGLALPYLVDIPHHEGPAFAHPDPAAVQTLSALHQKFILLSGVSNLLFWVVLGVISAWALNRWILNGNVSNAGANA